MATGDLFSEVAGDTFGHRRSTLKNLFPWFPGVTFGGDEGDMDVTFRGAKVTWVSPSLGVLVTPIYRYLLTRKKKGQGHGQEGQVSDNAGRLGLPCAVVLLVSLHDLWRHS